MRDVYVIAVNTIKFGKYKNKGIKDLTAETVLPCLKEAGLNKNDIQALWFSNTGWGAMNGQSSIRGQVALRPLGIESIPITNVENACAGGSTAFHHAWMGVSSGLYDITMAAGAEKMFHPNKYFTFTAFLGGMDIENIMEVMNKLVVYGMTDEDKKNFEAYCHKYSQKENNVKKSKKRRSISAGILDYRDMFTAFMRLGELIGYDTAKKIAKISSSDHSPFMDVYGYSARQHMKKYGSTPEQLAVIASKNHFHSSMNPNAQYTFTLTPEEILKDRIVSWPITRGMCAPLGDGAASAIVCDKKTVKQLGLSSRAVRVRASVLGSGKKLEGDEGDVGERVSKTAYEKSGIGPENIDLAEVHDATAFGEIHQAEALGFCPKGEGGRFAESGATKLGGNLPINTSGGLESRGHPIGASGLAQIHEMIVQLRGEAGKRQVKNARIAITENGGGALGDEEAAMCIHLFEAPSKSNK